MKVYADRSHYHLQDRYYLNDIVKALWNDLAEDQRAQKYGEWARLYQSVERIEDADAALLTMKWNYYRDRRLSALAGAAVEQARRAGKPLAVFAGGDSPAQFPFTGAHVFESSAYLSRPLACRSHGMPAVIPDYLEIYCGGKLHPRRKQNRPVVGFCGQAGGPAPVAWGRKAVRLVRQLSCKLGLTQEEPPPFETTTFRLKVLRHFEKHPGVETKFILRKKYRAGLDGRKDNFHPSRVAFVQNILDSDYTVCMRGGGNFSVRFYETLALGRIPIFINTDCLLPWQEQIDYRQFCVWVEPDEIDRAGEILLDFHNRIHPGDFEALQLKCRDLWRDYISANGFYTQFSTGVWIG